MSEIVTPEYPSQYNMVYTGKMYCDYNATNFPNNYTSTLIFIWVFGGRIQKPSYKLQTVNTQ